MVWDTTAEIAAVQFTSTLSLGVSGQGTLAVLATPAENANDSGTNLELGVNAGGVGEMEVFSSFVRFDDAEIGIVGNATVEISDTEWYAEQQSLGVQAQSRGFMTVSNRSNMTIEQSLGVGDGHLVVGSGGSGELQVTTISRLKTKVLKLGELALSSGVVSLNASDLKVDDDIFVGMAGSGTLTAIDSPIEANALYIARHAGSSGNVTFSARLLSLAADLHVGSGGDGRLTLSNNGLLLSDITNLGFEPGARGEIDVQEFTWDNARAIFVGVLGEGILKINSGGAVTSESGYLGQRGAGAGSVVMNGGNWTMTNTLGIGVNGRGSFEASGGAQVISPWSQIGLNMGSGGELRHGLAHGLNRGTTHRRSDSGWLGQRGKWHNQRDWRHHYDRHDHRRRWSCVDDV